MTIKGMKEKKDVGGGKEKATTKKDEKNEPKGRKDDMHSKAVGACIFKSTKGFQGLNTQQRQSEALQNTFTLQLQTFCSAALTEAQNVQYDISGAVLTYFYASSFER